MQTKSPVQQVLRIGLAGGCHIAARPPDLVSESIAYHIEDALRRRNVQCSIVVAQTELADVGAAGRVKAARAALSQAAAPDVLIVEFPNYLSRPMLMRYLPPRTRPLARRLKSALKPIYPVFRPALYALKAFLAWRRRHKFVSEGRAVAEKVIAEYASLEEGTAGVRNAIISPLPANPRKLPGSRRLEDAITAHLAPNMRSRGWIYLDGRRRVLGLNEHSLWKRDGVHLTEKGFHVYAEGIVDDLLEALDLTTAAPNPKPAR